MPPPICGGAWRQRQFVDDRGRGFVRSDNADFPVIYGDAPAPVIELLADRRLAIIAVMAKPIRAPASVREAAALAHDEEMAALAVAGARMSVL